MDHTVLPANTPCLLFLHKRSQNGTTTTTEAADIQDRFWVNQDVKYNFTVDLTGSGDRSEYEKICD